MLERRTLPDRFVVAAAVVLTTSVFLPAAADPVNPVKLLLAVWAAIASLALAAVRAVRIRLIRLPWGWAGGVLVALLLAFCVSAIHAPVPTTAVLGSYGRNSGLLAYLAGLVLLAVVLTCSPQGGVGWVCAALVAAGGFTASYGALQRLGLDSIAWSNPFNPIIASLGNPDFASGYLGICVPAAAWGALRATWPRWLRAGCALLALMFGAVAALTGSVQGPFGAAAGLGVLLLAWSLDLPRFRRRVAQMALLGLALVVGVTVAIGRAGHGPAASALSGLSFKSRVWYAQSALTMFHRHPLWGVGLDAYGEFFRQVRPIAATRALGGSQFTDAAHDVPLQMLAQGGLLLGLAYLALVLLVLASLIMGLRRLRGPARLLLGAVGGAWVAGEVQSWVSIDQVPFIVTQYVLAGAVLAASGAAVSRDFSLPGRLEPGRSAPRRGRRQPSRSVERLPPLTRGAVALLAGIAATAVAFAVWALVPLRADVAAAAGDQARVNRQPDLALAHYQEAATLVPGVSRYWARVAALDNDLGQVAAALAAYRQATLHDPYDVDAWRNTGRLADAAHQLDLARRCYQNAVRLDPDDAATVLDLARFDLQHAAATEAEALLARTLRVIPDFGPLLASLGDAQAVLGNPSGARLSYLRALKDDPGNSTATTGLAKLAHHV